MLDRQGPRDIQAELRMLSQKMKFLVKICDGVENETERQMAVELLGRELNAYAAAADKLASGLAASGPAGSPAPAGSPGHQPISAGPSSFGAPTQTLGGPKPLKAEPSKPLPKQPPSAPLDFAIDD